MEGYEPYLFVKTGMYCLGLPGNLLICYIMLHEPFKHIIQQYINSGVETPYKEL